MMRIIMICLTFGVAGFFAARALTECGCGSSSITITSTSTATGQITVSGNFTVAMGYTVNGISVYARPSGDGAGMGGEGLCAIVKGTFTSTVSVPTGIYDVQAVLTVQNNCDGTTTSYYSDTVTGVRVP